MAENDDKTTTATDDKKTTPPWGDNFDAERAWSLITNLRTDLDKVKGERDTAKTTLTEREDAEKTEAQRATDRASQAEAAAAQARRELLVERATRKHNVPEDLVEFLTGETEDEIEAKAARLGGLGNKDGQEPTAETPPADAHVFIKPKPAMTPGHGDPSGNDDDFDPAAIAAAARRGY